jgi:hypothetical protein
MDSLCSQFNSQNRNARAKFTTDFFSAKRRLCNTRKRKMNFAWCVLFLALISVCGAEAESTRLPVGCGTNCTSDVECTQNNPLTPCSFCSNGVCISYVRFLVASERLLEVYCNVVAPLLPNFIIVFRLGLIYLFLSIYLFILLSSFILTLRLCGIGCRSTDDCQNGGSNQCIYCNPNTRTCVNPNPLCGGYCPSMSS